MKKIGTINACIHGAVLAAAAALALYLSQGRVIAWPPLFYADSLSGFFILTIAVVNFASALYSSGYIARDLEEGRISPRKAVLYYVLFNLFACTMFLVTVFDNLGLMWVSIEMTTLVSAFLVGFYNDKRSVEAAWKYLILCSVGLTLALFGTILFYYALSAHAGRTGLNWTDMLAAAPFLNARVIEIAFIFILVGYGTKAGLAPMHSWLPDAHSQAPAPISALLSGVLLKTSLYAIMRYTAVANETLGPAFTGNLLVLFGVVSLAVAAGFVLVQKDVKRLLAYSSIEHVGIAAFGLGIGGPLGVFGALFHVFNHAVTKSFMFLGAGEIVRAYGTHNMNRIRGALTALPVTGALVLLGAFALAGMPPFSVFFSELTILMAGFSAKHYLACGLFLFFIAVVFGGLVHHFGRIVLGKKPDEIPVARTSPAAFAPLVFLMLCMLVFGMAMPEPFRRILVAAAGVIR